MEISLEKVLQGLEFTMDQFIDLCILLGCDYCDSIRGIGPSRAVQLLRDHGSIEEVLKSLDSKKYKIPSDWPFEEARKLFKNPLVTDPAQLNVKNRILNSRLNGLILMKKDLFSFCVKRRILMKIGSERPCKNL